jgi:hypothetical protein
VRRVGHPKAERWGNRDFEPQVGTRNSEPWSGGIAPEKRLRPSSLRIETCVGAKVSESPAGCHPAGSQSLPLLLRGGACHPTVWGDIIGIVKEEAAHEPDTYWQG